MLKICIYIGINAHVTLVHGQRTECEDRARILKQNSQLRKWGEAKDGLSMESGSFKNRVETIKGRQIETATT